MAKVALIGCTSKKKDYPCPALELYSDSALFQKEIMYANGVLKADAIYILSAKHHLVSTAAVLEPYNVTLNNQSKAKRKEWADVTFDEIVNTFTQDDELYFLCGKKYGEMLLPLLEDAGYRCYTPLGGGQSLPIGKLLSWLNVELAKGDLL